LLEGQSISVDDIKVRGIGKTFGTLGESVISEVSHLPRHPVPVSRADSTYSVYFDKIGRVDTTPVFLLDERQVGDEVKGPAMIIDDTQTIVVVPGATAVVCSKHLYITLD